MLNHFHDFGGRAVERNAHRFASGEFDGAFVLWDRRVRRIRGLPEWGMGMAMRGGMI